MGHGARVIDHRDLYLQFALFLLKGVGGDQTLHFHHRMVLVVSHVCIVFKNKNGISTALANIPTVPKNQSFVPSPPFPLTGKTILVTRSMTQAGQFSTRLEQEGATVIEMPALEIGPPSSWESLDQAIAHLAGFDWLILTSTNSVDYFFERLATLQATSVLTGLKIAVVGEKTAESLRQRSLQPDFVPPEFMADSLVQHLPPLAGKKVLFPRVETGGREVLVKELMAEGAEVVEVAAYQSQCPVAIAPVALVALQQQAVDVITFASSKTVKCFYQLVAAIPVSPLLEEWLQKVCIASIGPQTSKTCLDLLGRVDVEAKEYTLEGLTQAIVRWVTDERFAV